MPNYSYITKAWCLVRNTMFWFIDNNRQSLAYNDSVAPNPRYVSPKSPAAYYQGIPIESLILYTCHADTLWNMVSCFLKSRQQPSKNETLAHHWTNSKPTLGQRLLFARKRINMTTSNRQFSHIYSFWKCSIFCTTLQTHVLIIEIDLVCLDRCSRNIGMDMDTL